MIYPQHFEQKIGFVQIRQNLKSLCLSSLGENEVDSMIFLSEYEEIVHLLQQTSEMKEILEKEEFPTDHYHDMTLPLERMKIEGTFLETNELLALAQSLDTIIRVKHFILSTTSGNVSASSDEKPIYKYPELQKLSSDANLFPNIIKAIERIVDPYGEMKDNASPTLSRIRMEMSNTARSISQSLKSVMNKSKSEGYSEKDWTPTVRDGRLVIPVVPAMKKRIKGIVHGESDSGRTVFVEPTEVVEANNRIRELESEEKAEIIRILKEMAALIRPSANDMIQSYLFLGKMDFIRAKAQWAISTQSVMPIVNQHQVIDWGHAVHPLLKINLEKHHRDVVPLDIQLNEKQRILVISGPNAGGKSVCLKTVGLLQYMLQCGLLVPMHESSKTGVFKNLFLDIGDEQSMEDDLSTYSSHLYNLKQMLKYGDDKTLILIDEFGSGTEPQIGGAIAESVLKHLNVKKVFGIITTHYHNLKLLARDTEGIVNGAMLYDRKDMRALFTLSIGNPGSSFAIEIARKIGLPASVIDEASAIVGSDYIKSDKFLLDIVRDRKYWENKRSSIRQQEKQLEALISKYQKDALELRAEKKAIISKAKQESQELLRNSNAKIEQTIREIKEAQAEKEKTKEIRQELNDFKHQIDEMATDLMQENIQKKMDKIRRRQERKRNEMSSSKADHRMPSSKNDKNSTPSTPLKTGDYVRLKGQSVTGQIEKITGKEADVVFGTVHTRVELNRLETTTPPDSRNQKITFVSQATQDDIRQKNLQFKQEIDVRGMRGDEALRMVTYFIDDAVVAGVRRVRILHGTGTGVLKTLIRDYLSKLSSINGFKDEHIQLGGAGITVVDLN